MSFLPALKYEELFTFQKKGNFNNWKYGITKAPNDNVLPFNWKFKNGSTITTFEARKGYIWNDEFILTDTIDLLSDITINKSGDFYHILANEGLDSNLENGLYYYYFTDGINQGKSDIFCIDGTIQDFINEWVDENGIPFFNELDESFVSL